MSFFAGLALRIKRGQAGLSGNEITFETEGCALGLQAALTELGVPCAVTKAGHQHKVRLTTLPAGQAGVEPVEQTAVESNQPAAPAEFFSPAAVTSKATTKPAQNIPNFIPKASEPAPGAEKRRRFAELAKKENLETASKLAGEQAQLELFSPAKGKRKRTK